MNKRLLALYSAGHFWMDLSCALLLFRTLLGSPDLVLCLLVYNFCAFALQMPFGLLADRLDRNGAVAAAGCILTALAYLSPVPVLTAVTAGVGNALFHTGGGREVLRGGETAGPVGVFAAPGGLGLFLGTLWGKGDALGLWLGPFCLAVLAAAILWTCYWQSGTSRRSGSASPDLDAPAGYGPLALLFLASALQSWVGMAPLPWAAGSWALALAAALFAGKTAGGFLARRLGPRRMAAWVLLPAAGLYLASRLPLPGILAAPLFHATVPLVLWAAGRCLPGAKGFAWGLMKFGLFLGYLPSALGWHSPVPEPWGCAVAALVLLVLLWPAVGKKVVRC